MSAWESFELEANIWRLMDRPHKHSRPPKGSLPLRYQCLCVIIYYNLQSALIQELSVRPDRNAFLMTKSVPPTKNVLEKANVTEA